MPRRRSPLITVFTCRCRSTASPKLRVRFVPWPFSMEKKTGRTRGERERRPRIVGLRSERSSWMRHVPLTTAGVPLTILAKEAQRDWLLFPLTGMGPTPPSHDAGFRVRGWYARYANRTRRLIQSVVVAHGDGGR